MGKKLYFDTGKKGWIEEYGRWFHFVDDYCLDETGNISELAHALGVKPEELKTNPAFKFTRNKVYITKEAKIKMLTDCGCYKLPEVDVNGIKLDLIIFPEDRIKVEILDL